MINYEISSEYIRMEESSSTGAQVKFFYGDYWYKQNAADYEGYSEFLVSLLMKHSTLTDYVSYEVCMINGKSGCRSKNFLQDGENFVTFERLCNINTGQSLQNAIYQYSSVSDRKQFVLDFIESATDLDLSEYLETILQLDCITLNTDRHFHNLGVIKAGTVYRVAPIFDNGAALLSNFSQFPPYLDLEDCVQNAYARPFSGSFTQQANLDPYV